MKFAGKKTWQIKHANGRREWEVQVLDFEGCGFRRICVHLQFDPHLSHRATVLVKDGDNNPVPDVTIEGQWTGAIEATSTALTDANGRAIFETDQVKYKNPLTFTFSVTKINGEILDSPITGVAEYNP